MEGNDWEDSELAWRFFDEEPIHVNTTLIGAVDTPGDALGIDVVGDIAYVADGDRGLSIVPVPKVIEPVVFDSETKRITVTLPSPLMAGHYTLSVFNEEEHHELYGAVAFVPPEEPDRYHSADYNPRDNTISLSELLRVIQFYNNRFHHCDPQGEDGYAPEKGDETCIRHSSDYNPPDWQISLSELLRMIQFYNDAGYHADPEGEDGFASGK